MNVIEASRALLEALNSKYDTVSLRVSRKVVPAVKELEKALARAITDTERLDFVLDNEAFTARMPPKDPYGAMYQLITQNEDEEFIVLSGDGRWFKTERDAIDAAISLQRQGEKA